MNAAGERTVEDLEVGELLDLTSYGLPGFVLVLVAVTPAPFPGDGPLLTYQWLAWPDGVDQLEPAPG